MSEQSLNLSRGQRITQSQAAQIMNVSRSVVQMAVRVRKTGIAELMSAVEQGKLSVSAAAEVARLSQDEQRTLVSQGKAAIVAKAKELRERKKNKKAVSPSLFDENEAITRVIDTIDRAIVMWPKDRDLQPLANALQSYVASLQRYIDNA